MASRLEFVSLFSGAGGLDLGFEAAGWHCLFATDYDPVAIATLDANKGTVVTVGGRKFTALRDTLIHQADVTLLNGWELLAKLGAKRGEVPALVGGPPCQSWSSAGHQRGFHDPRGRLVDHYLRIATELDVRWLVFENVRGLLTARGQDGVPGSALHHIRQSLLGAGFQTEVNLLNAADYGTPQRRVRLFMIGFRRGDRPTFPDATHSKTSGLLPDDLKPWVTLKDCLQTCGPREANDMIFPSPQLRASLSRVPEGSGLKSPGKAETTRPGGHWGYKQGCFVADPSLPARTVTASSQQDWIRDKLHGLRRLSPRECAAIQSFPPEWKFVGTKPSQYRQIGNAVPPLLGCAIASSLASHMQASNRFRSKPMQSGLLPLKPELVSAIDYTRREEARNGESRRRTSPKRRSRLATK
jgi:DNA (cytosine-5)-methyltransferase 1